MRWELSTSKEESILKFLLYGGIPIVLYFLALFFNLKEVPVWDEYDVLLDFITKMEIESSSYDQFLLFIGKPLEQYTWYLLRLLSILEYILTGSISFSWQVYLGNSMLVFFYYALYKYALKHYHIVLTPIIGLIIFQYCYWEVSFWGLSAVHSFFSLVIIIIISIILMSNEGYSNVFWIIMLSFTLCFGFND